MADERALPERVGVLEVQVGWIKDTITKLDGLMEATTRNNTLVAQMLVEVKTTLSAHNKELDHGRDHMQKTDGRVDRLEKTCHETAPLRKAGWEHLAEAPKEQQRTAGAWMSSKLLMQMFLGMMGVWLALTGWLIYLISSGKIKIIG